MNARGTGTRYLLAAVVAAALTLGAVGCSSDSKSGSSTTSEAGPTATRTDTGSTEADLKKAAAALAALSLKASSDSYAYLSASCKAKFSSSAWASNQRQVVDGLKAVVPAMATAKVGDTTVRNVTPVAGEAQVIIVDSGGTPLADPENTDWTAWVVEDGMWVTTNCVSAKELLTGG